MESNSVQKKKKKRINSYDNLIVKGFFSFEFLCKSYDTFKNFVIALSLKFAKL